MADEGILWMGSLQPHMNAKFIRSAFNQMGENIVWVNMKCDYYTSEPANYCFVQFPDDYSALLAMHKLKYKMVPGSNPPVKFNLMHTSLRGPFEMKENYSVFVYGLSPDVDDCTLFEAFVARYPSVRHANVIRDDKGSRGFGFVRFAKQEEQVDAANYMNRYKGIGSFKILVYICNPNYKGNRMKTTNQPTSVVHGTCGELQPTTTQQDYSQYYGQCRNSYAGSAAASANDYSPMNPAYDHTQIQGTPPQRLMISAADQAPLLSPPIGIPTAYSYQRMGQLQPTPQQPPMMPAASEDPLLRLPLGIELAKSSQYVGQQQPTPQQPPMMPEASEDPLLRLPVGIQLAHSSQDEGQQQPALWQSVVTPTASQAAQHPEPIGIPMTRQRTAQLDDGYQLFGKPCRISDMYVCWNESVSHG